MNLETLIYISGVLHFGTLIGSAQVPKELDFKNELPKLSPMLRHWVLTAGAYVVINLIAFGLICIFCAGPLTSGTPLARAFCLYVAAFWAIRLMIQFFLYDARPYLRTWFLKVGYYGLTIVFTWHTLVFSYAALLANGNSP